MCEIMQKIKEEGIEEGRIRTVIQMYRDKKLLLEEACSYIELNEEAFKDLERTYPGYKYVSIQ